MFIDRANRLPTSPLREYSSQANDDVAQSYRGGYTRNRRAGVRFYDDMDTDDHIHVLHRSLRDLSSNQQRLERDFNRELTTRDKYVNALFNFCSKDFIFKVYKTAYIR